VASSAACGASAITRALGFASSSSLSAPAIALTRPTRCSLGDVDSPAGQAQIARDTRADDPLQRREERRGAEFDRAKRRSCASAHDDADAIIGCRSPSVSEMASRMAIESALSRRRTAMPSESMSVANITRD
jgi:hypothetical protein